jgi:hypothetical protein
MVAPAWREAERVNESEAEGDGSNKRKSVAHGVVCPSCG